MNQHFRFQVVCLSSPVVELFVCLKHQAFCSSKLNVDKESSNINEVIRPVLKFFFFYDKILHAQKAQNIKNVYKKHLSSNIKSLR